MWLIPSGVALRWLQAVAVLGSIRGVRDLQHLVKSDVIREGRHAESRCNVSASRCDASTVGKSRTSRNLLHTTPSGSLKRVYSKQDLCWLTLECLARNAQGRYSVLPPRSSPGIRYKVRFDSTAFCCVFPRIRPAAWPDVARTPTCRAL
ncbi:hypothetical protein C8R44DRAFT_820119 [Mycena epipterygia]|nr:hypothetical protein C8R44DRAFT_820119 [Mycena epipterygia]